LVDPCGHAFEKKLLLIRPFSGAGQIDGALDGHVGFDAPFGGQKADFALESGLGIDADAMAFSGGCSGDFHGEEKDWASA